MSYPKKYYFCGIGGNGMSPLARLLAARGATVIGSDRSYDTGVNLPFFNQLIAEGISMVPQDGSGVDTSITTFVITRAVEESIPDIKRARELNLKILKRPRLMAELFTDTKNIAVGGTSGKSTTTGMIAHILASCGKDPTVMNGAVMLNNNKNFLNGKSDLAVFEADESDGFDDVISVCPAHIAVLTNISLDHFSIGELNEMFAGFVKRAGRGVVLNADCPHSMQLRSLNPSTITFGESSDADFSARKYPIPLTLPGKHNVLNALAAVATCSFLGIEPADSIAALKTFRGIQRRLELVGESGGIRVIDDFASNPGKIAASIEAVRDDSRRLVVVFQPHGFQPTKMMKQGYIDTFSSVLREQDLLLMPDIYYAGGSANLVNGEIVALPTDISSADVVKGVNALGKVAKHIPDRQEIVTYLSSHLVRGDTVIVMGSRDQTLSDFAHAIHHKLAQSSSS